MKTKSTKQAKTFGSPDEARSDAELEQFISDHRDEIEAKLQEARTSIARGDTAPLESLEALLREARRHHKALG